MLAAAGSGCGGGDSAQEALEERIAEERADAAQGARQRQKLKQLEKDLSEIERGSSDGESSAEPSSGSTSADAVLSYGRYASANGGWQADVPVGGGWSDGVETQINSGLHRTTFTGPSGAVLLVDSTPSERPAYRGSAARTPVSHPIYGDAERLVFRGNTSVTPCETTTCVDFLIPAGGGGYAVLVGGPGNFAELETIAETVMLSLTGSGG
jgi:hypothetical protein